MLVGELPLVATDKIYQHRIDPIQTGTRHQSDIVLYRHTAILVCCRGQIDIPHRVHS